MDIAVKDLTPESLAKAFESAFHDANLNPEDENQEVYVEDLGIYVLYDEKRGYILFYGIRWSPAERSDLIALCNSINLNLAVVCASVTEEKDDDGDYTIYFRHQLVVYPEDLLTAKSLVRLGRRFSEVIGYSIDEYDDADLIK